MCILRLFQIEILFLIRSWRKNLPSLPLKKKTKVPEKNNTNVTNLRKTDVLWMVKRLKSNQKCFKILLPSLYMFLQQNCTLVYLMICPICWQVVVERSIKVPLLKIIFVFFSLRIMQKPTLPAMRNTISSWNSLSIRQTRTSGFELVEVGLLMELAFSVSSFLRVLCPRKSDWILTAAALCWILNKMQIIQCNSSK